jgi:hypothetical protein
MYMCVCHGGKIVYCGMVINGHPSHTSSTAQGSGGSFNDRLL